MVFSSGILLAPLGKFLPSSLRPGPGIGWILVAVGLLGLLLLAGWWWRGTPHGIYSTPRNVASLSSLQAFLWLALIASVLLVVAVWNISGFEGESDAVRDQALQVGAVVGTAGFSTGIVVAKKRRNPTENAVTGIAKKSVAGSPKVWAHSLAQAMKEIPRESPEGALTLDRLSAGVTKIRGEKPDEESLTKLEVTGLLEKYAPKLDKSTIEKLLQGHKPQGLSKLPGPEFVRLRDLVKQAAQTMAVADLQRHRDGTMYRNLCPCQAKFSDVLEGDEIANGTNKELGRVQFLVFTAVGVVAFVALVWSQFRGLKFGDVQVPSIPKGLTELLAVSGAGYLGYKLPSRTPHQE